MLGGMSNRGVCGSDGVTYMNECELKRANCESDEEISLVYNDFCESECALNSMEINMQCGTNGLTYWNMCALKEFNYLKTIVNDTIRSEVLRCEISKFKIMKFLK